MTHFAVLVVGDIEYQLEPFQENNMDDCPKKYMEWVSKTDELKENFENDSREMLVLANGDVVEPYDDKYMNPEKFGISFGGEKPNYIYPEGSVLKEFPMTKIYKDVGEYAKDYEGYTIDPEKGEYGYWHNPNSKWDWYQMGGRFSDRLLFKDGVEGNSCLVKHLDWEGMKANRIKKAEIWWQNWLNSDSYRKGHTSDYEYDVHNGETKEEYIKRHSTLFYDIVVDREWYSIGEHGWWGVLNEEKEYSDWQSECDRIISKLDPNEWISVVDCHV